MLIMLISWGTFIVMGGVGEGGGGGGKVLQTREMLIMLIVLAKKVLKTREMSIMLMLWGTFFDIGGA